MIKSDLRKIYLARQIGLAPSDRSEKSRQIAQRFFDSFELERVKFLHCYIAMEKFNEIDTSFIFSPVWKEFGRTKTLVPRVNFETGEIENRRYGALTPMAQNVWGINEPFDPERVETSAIDMVLVPGLAFDESGHRVGYGKGFYDRFLALCRTDCVKIGLSFFTPVKEIAETHGADVRLDYVITPDQVFSFEA